MRLPTVVALATAAALGACARGRTAVPVASPVVPPAGASAAAAIPAATIPDAASHAAAVPFVYRPAPPVVPYCVPERLSPAPELPPRASSLELVDRTRRAAGDSSLLQVVVGEGRAARRFAGPDFCARYVSERGEPKRLRVDTSGRLVVRLALVAPGPRGRPDTLAVGRVQFALAPNTWFFAEASRGGRRPWGHCAGTVTAVPLRGPAGVPDTMFLAVGQLSRNAIC